MEIKILGMGCANCKKFAENAKTAIDELGLGVEVQKVEDLAQIMSYGVMQPPGLLVDGVLKASGRVLNVAEIKEILKG